ncbi:hypothetical protein [endosymbiont DhMRE of Dentiscutata heterogama]|uniref:hypothetical protein n=1 Tax=endosymbiont DhMRE of Dentiscutata heterogama TaxID=1609546 RepID=UPI002AD2C35B|nr:hypothetical protein [endosymbiont DhMRE of Dentiscutata heterogama]
MGGGFPPAEKDLKVINEGWEKGGLLIPNLKVNPRGELLLKLLQQMLNQKEIQVRYIDGKIYLESNNLVVEIKKN